MQVELGRCIATAQQILTDLGTFVPAQFPPQHNASAILSTIASSGIPKIEDSRIPAALGVKLHSVTVSFFQKACMGLLETHGHKDASALRSIALQLRRAYTNVYERKIVHAACTLPRPRPQEKQPYATDILVYAFEHSQTPSRRERERLAALTGMTVEQVRVWFQNRRSRNKKKPTELQSRPGIPLHDLLERVALIRKAATMSENGSQNDFDDSNDSGYGSGVDRPAYCLRHLAALPTPAPTTRSYPAVYVPQPMSALATLASPCWARTPAAVPANSHSTVTIDELTRSMARLTLRHRRPSPRPSTHGVTTTVSAHGDQIIAPVYADNKARKDAQTGRRIAGARRAASNTTASAASIQPIVVPVPSSHPPSDPPSPPCKGRKKVGPPPRRPTGRTLRRQVSDASSASASSSDSCRSTSLSSDSSMDSAVSNSSMTSIDSASTEGPDGFQSNLEGVLSFVSCQQMHEAHVPVYDLSSMTFPAPDVSAPRLSTLLGDPEMHRLLQATQSYQQNTMLDDPPAVGLPFVADSQTFDVGVANMGAYLDLSATVFPTLDALLSDNDALYPTLPAQPVQCGGFELAPQPRPQDISWQGFGLMVPAGA